MVNFPTPGKPLIRRTQAGGSGDFTCSEERLCTVEHILRGCEVVRNQVMSNFFFA